MANKDILYMFLQAFKQNSAVFINNFFRGHSYNQYLEGQCDGFDFATGGVNFNEWGNSIMALTIIRYLSEAERKGYCTINDQYMELLLEFANFMAECKPLEEKKTVYRGCNSLEVDGLNGLVSATKNMKIAKQFNRGTILKINLPRGMKLVDVDIVRPNKRSEDIEAEIILPPCNYTIVKDEIIDLKGPNNPSGKTRMVEIDVTPKDLLREFAITMVTPPKDYIENYGMNQKYEEAYSRLTIELIRRTINSCAKSPDVIGTGVDGQIDVINRPGMYGTSKEKETNMSRSFQLMSSNIPLSHQISEFMRGRTITNNPKIKHQITPMDFYQYVMGSENKEVFFDYLKTDDHEKFYKHEDHGIRHVDNVTMFTYYIASKEGYSKDGIRILMEAARHHDMGRTNGWEEGNHGLIGAKKYFDEYLHTIPTGEQIIVRFLIFAHDLPRVELVKKTAKQMLGEFLNEDQINTLCDMAKIIRDADALDRTRFPALSPDYLDSRYLTHDSARELIEVAQTINYREEKATKSNRRTEKGESLNIES